MLISTETRQKLEEIRASMELHLRDNELPFWTKNTWDEPYGGFLTRLDRRGDLLETGEKFLMMQARMVIALSLAHLHGIRGRGYLELAGKGFDFMAGHLWDPAEGGFFHSCSRAGTPNTTRKNTDAHSYALVSLTQYYRASGRAEALEYANRVFDLFVTRAADSRGGYIEDFDGGVYELLNSEQMNLGGRTDIKTIDMHTNMMESLLYLSKVTRDPRHLAALKGVLELIAEKGIDKRYGCSITALDADLNPLADLHGLMTTSYCLNAEIAWLMLEAVDLLGENREAWRPVILGLVDHALSNGFDRERGGLVSCGPMAGSAFDDPGMASDRLVKPWWGQAELLNALIDLYAWTGSPTYFSAFEKQFDWVWNHQIDHECGSWYQEIRWEDCRPVTEDKGQEYKTAFHTTRGLVHVADAIGRLLAE